MWVEGAVRVGCGALGLATSVCVAHTTYTTSSTTLKGLH